MGQDCRPCFAERNPGEVGDRQDPATGNARRDGWRGASAVDLFATRTFGPVFVQRPTQRTVGAIHFVALTYGAAITLKRLTAAFRAGV